MNEAEEFAKAIQETARFGQLSVETAQKAGGFFARVLKVPIEEGAGIIADKLRFVRWKRLIHMADEVNAILEAKGVRETRSVPPKLALPIMEEATLEEDESLRSLWNHLLANAMNPDFNDELRYGFIDMIKNITAIEARLLHGLYVTLERERKLLPLYRLYAFNFKREGLERELGLALDVYAVSANNLMRMQLIGPAILKGGIGIGSEPITIYKGIDAVSLTPLGAKFVEACMR